MAEEEQLEQSPSSFSTHQMPQEEQWYNLQLLEGQIAGKQANEDVVAAMVVENPTFVDERGVVQAHA